jgi:hypothetical protein
MKALFRLKKVPHRYIEYLTNEQAEECYRTSFLGTGNNIRFVSRYIPSGFHTKILDFEDWLNYYGFTIL